MLVCNKCGKIVDESELGYVTEPHGERHLNTVCRCGGDFIPATQCSICGKWFDNTELHGVCEGCLSDYETVETAIEIGEKNLEKREINGFFANILTTEMINFIIAKWVTENYVDHSKAVVEYLEDDVAYFSGFLEDKYKE